jgi:Ca-activated chloride channel homolog
MKQNATGILPAELSACHGYGPTVSYHFGLATRLIEDADVRTRRSMIRVTQLAALQAHRRGGVLVFLVAGVVMLLAFAMITVDVASMQLARTQLRAASDAAAKAGAEALLRTQNATTTKKAAVDMGALNKVSGQPLKLADSDVTIGSSARQSDGSWTFSAGGTRPNAVRVNAAMSGGTGPVKLAFGKIFGAGTFMPMKTSTASVLEQEVCLALDRSASMAFDLSGEDWSYPYGRDYDDAPHASLSRWAALNSAVKAYLAAAKDTALPPRVSLVTWGSNMGDSPKDQPVGSKLTIIDTLLGRVVSGLLSLLDDPDPNYPTAQIEARLTKSTDKLQTVVQWRGRHVLHGATNMSAGLDKAVSVLTASDVKPYAKRSIILMTDGQWNEGRDPVDAAEDARDKGITVHVVTFLPGAQSADMDTVASITGGKHIHANTQAELVAAFEELARTLPVVLTD